MIVVSSQHDGLTYAQRAALAATAGDQDRSRYEVAPRVSEPADARPRLSSVDEMLALLTLAAAHDGQRRSRYEAAAMFEILREYAIDDVRAAIIAHVRRSRYPVRTADIVELIENEDLS